MLTCESVVMIVYLEFICERHRITNGPRKAYDMNHSSSISQYEKILKHGMIDSNLRISSDISFQIHTHSLNRQHLLQLILWNKIHLL